MSKISEYGVVSNISSTGYVLGVQDDVTVRFKAETFKGETGEKGDTGLPGSPGAVVAFYLQQNFGGF